MEIRINQTRKTRLSLSVELFHLLISSGGVSKDIDHGIWQASVDNRKYEIRKYVRIYVTTDMRKPVLTTSHTINSKYMIWKVIQVSAKDNSKICIHIPTHQHIPTCIHIYANTDTHPCTMIHTKGVWMTNSVDLRIYEKFGPSLSPLNKIGQPIVNHLTNRKPQQ